MKEFESRINLSSPMEVLAHKVCQEYNLGDFIKCQLIEIGYEDYNFVLTTNEGKYVVKVFSNERTDEDAINLANRASFAFEHGFSSPEVYKTKNQEILAHVEIDNIRFRLIVMEFIDGKDFYTLDILPNDNELEKIATEIAKLNNLQFNPPFIYDKWAIVNFIEEYEKNIKYVDEEDRAIIEYAYKLFKNCDFDKLKKGFVHGDIIETNIIRKNNGNLYFIDFSVSNYQPRIVDLAVSICDLCLDLNNLDLSKKRAEKFVADYEKVSPLSAYEKECLKTFIICHQAITILETTREKVVEENGSEENEKFLQKGKVGLRYVLGDELEDIKE